RRPAAPSGPWGGPAAPRVPPSQSQLGRCAERKRSLHLRAGPVRRGAWRRHAHRKPVSRDRERSGEPDALSHGAGMIYRAIAILCLLAATAGAQTSRPATDFPRGLWSLTLEGAYAHSFDLSPARIETVSMGVGYYFMDNLSLNAEAAGFWV